MLSSVSLEQCGEKFPFMLLQHDFGFLPAIRHHRVSKEQVRETTMLIEEIQREFNICRNV
jgi:hypothetical protein